MPLYTVKLIDAQGNPNGEMHVNAQDEDAARANVRAQGAYDDPGPTPKVEAADGTPGAYSSNQTPAFVAPTAAPAAAAAAPAGVDPYSTHNTEYYTLGQHNAASDATAAAEQASLAAYRLAQAQNMSDTLAFEKAKEAAAEVYQQQTLGLDSLKLSASLTGPRNAFQQQQLNYGLNAGGYSNLAGAIAGQYSLPTFQAPQGTPQAATLGTLAADMGGQQTSGQQNTQGFLSALPAPNQIVASQWNALPKDSQDFLLSAYNAKGFSANDVQDALKAGMPSFKAPLFGAADSASA